MEKRPVQFLYRDGDDYHFMDNDTYDQFVLTAEQLGEAAQYMKDGMTLDRTSYQGETIGVELPVTVDLVVARDRAGLRRRHPDRRPQAGHDRDRPRRHRADLRRGGRHDPGRHPDRGVPDPGLTRVAEGQSPPANRPNSRPTGPCNRTCAKRAVSGSRSANLCAAIPVPRARGAGIAGIASHGRRPTGIEGPPGHSTTIALAGGRVPARSAARASRLDPGNRPASSSAARRTT